MNGIKERDDDENNNNNNVGDEWMKKPTRQWSSCLKNPRIVRVSRGFGGKDRHSKVCTIRGLRDRRIRLSVPTAIQLYDLQDRLGLSQPSKVVEWLIDATKQEIEKLPPLPIIPTSDLHLQQQQENEGFGGFHVQNFFPLNTHHDFSGPNFLHWEPPNLSLSQLGGAYSFGQHHSLSSTSDQLYLSPSATAITANPPFPSMEIINNADHFRQINNHDHHHFQNLQHQNSSLFPTTLHFMKSSTLSANSKDFFSQENGTDDGKVQEKHKR